MERQLVKHGTSTLMVSLPKRWLDQHGLKKGDPIHITPLPEKLILSKKERGYEQKEIRVHLPHADYDEIRTVLGSLYRKGYTTVIATYADPHCIYFIQLLIKAIHGFEIIEQSEDKCVIKNLTKEIDVDVDEMINKIMNIIKMEFILVKEYLTNGITGKDNEIKMIRDDCWKFRNMVYLHLKETLLFSAYDGYFKAHLFEYNASFLYWLYRSFDRSVIKTVSKDFLTLYDEVTAYFVGSISKMKKKDADYIEYIMTNREKLLAACEAYTLTKNKDRFLAIYLAMLVQNIHNPKSLII